MTKNIFTTTAGVEIPITPIAIIDLQLAQDAIKREFEARGEPIEPPTYEVDVLGGEKEIHPYNTQTIMDAPPEDKEKWDKYLEAIGRMENEIQQRTAIVFMDGILVDLPEDEGWAERRKKLFGEEVPTDPDQKKLYYINNILLKTPADKSGVMMAIQRLSLTGANQEAIDAMEELFRRQMEAQGRAGVEALKAAVQKETADLVLQSDSQGQLNGKSLGANTKSVSPTKRRRPVRNDSNRVGAK